MSAHQDSAAPHPLISVPLVSVIVPVYNGAAFILSALESIRAQSYANLELLVVDDGSTDNTRAVVPQCFPDLQYLYQANRGPAAARNLGLQHATGEFITFLDADDLWPMGRLSHHLQLLADFPLADIVIGPTRMILYDESQKSEKTMLPAPMIQHQVGSATYRRRVFERIGNFDVTLWLGEDAEWFRRALGASTEIQITAEIALDYRLRPGSLSFGQSSLHKGFLAALRARLHQHRATMNHAHQGEA